MDYLQFTSGAFVSLNNNKSYFADIQAEMQKLDVALTDIQMDEKSYHADEFVKTWQLPDLDVDERRCAIITLRYAFWLERQMIEKYVSPMARGKSPLQEAVLIHDNINDVNVHSFFISDPHRRLKSVFESFVKYKHLTARIDTHKHGGDIEDVDNAVISENTFRRLNYEVKAEKDILHASLYSELLCRLTVLKLCVEEILKSITLKGFLHSLEHMSLPSQNIRGGINQLQSHPYFYLYPHFWQIFIYVFGGFILTCKKDEEYEILSTLTGVPKAEVDNALSAFDILFPIPNDSWLLDKPYTKTRILKFMPLPFSGLGANYRRIVYCKDKNKCSYDDLATLLPSDFTCTDLIKYNNLAVTYF